MDWLRKLVTCDAEKVIFNLIYLKLNSIKKQSAIPGELYGYYKAHQLAGRLPWRELFKPTIKLCEDGFPISLALAETLRIRENFVRNNTALREWFINPATNSIYKKGDIIKCPKLAATFREISENGYETFYRGSLAAKIVKEINQNGLISIDLMSYTIF